MRDGGASVVGLGISVRGRLVVGGVYVVTGGKLVEVVTNRSGGGTVLVGLVGVVTVGLVGNGGFCPGRVGEKGLVGVVTLGIVRNGGFCPGRVGENPCVVVVVAVVVAVVVEVVLVVVVVVVVQGSCVVVCVVVVVAVVRGNPVVVGGAGVAPSEDVSMVNNWKPFPLCLPRRSLAVTDHR